MNSSVQPNTSVASSVVAQAAVAEESKEDRQSKALPPSLADEDSVTARPQNLAVPLDGSNKTQRAQAQVPLSREETKMGNVMGIGFSKQLADSFDESRQLVPRTDVSNVSTSRASQEQFNKFNNQLAKKTS